MHSGRILAVLLIIVALAARVDADTIRIDQLACLRTEERGGLDQIRLEYRIDNGRMQKLPRRNMRRGHVWGVGKSLSFERSILIQVYEYDRTRLNRDEKIGAVVIRAGTIGNNSVQTFTLDGHGAKYWLAVGVGNFVSPKPPTPAPPRTEQPKWLAGGTYSTPDAASARAAELQDQNYETRVVLNLYGLWEVIYRVAPETRDWLSGGIFSTSDLASARAAELQQTKRCETRVLLNLHGLWEVLYRKE